ncbi:hypothetical protein EKG39_04640 [Shewanella atlantica]|uniref:Uncharacterized protein n=1 Tax=Shewanella atlantica TaxID=271099 RepID=A0A431WHF8_9GAMM|nr:hypothetical protein EKG39_04640 [Shewanella atlantica]
MINRFPGNLRQGVKVWPLIITFLMIVGFCLGLNYYVMNGENLTASCKANIYNAFEGRPTDVVIDITTKGKLVELQYRFLEEEIEQSSIIMRGTLLELDLETMTYRLALDSGELLSHISPPRFPERMSRLIEYSRNPLSGDTPHSIPLDIHVLDMNAVQGNAVIQFRPGNGIWACDLN